MAGKSDTALRRLLWTALLLAGGLTAAVAEPVHGRSSELGIQFELVGGADWCDAAVVVQLVAANGSVYQPEGAEFLKMVGRIRAVIHDQCTKVERILFAGFVKEQKVFAAEMTKLTRWRRFISLDPETETPLCTPPSPDDGECDKRIAAYAAVMDLMQGPAFADVELTSVMEDRTDLHAAWLEKGAYGALQLSHRSEYDGRYTDNAAFADDNIDGIVKTCMEEGGQTARLPAPDYGASVSFRSALCRLPGKPLQFNLVLVKSVDDWFYLFILWGEEPHMVAANALALRLAGALAARR